MAAAIEGAAAIGCPPAEIAQVCGMHHTTFLQRMKEEPWIVEAIDRGRERGKTTLRRLQWAAAQKGDKTILIWLGKILLGQREQLDLNNRQIDADGNTIAPGTTFVLKVER